MDSGGIYFYFKDDDTIWSPGWKLCNHECRNGLNYTVIKGEMNKLAANVLYFVPLKTWAEIQNLL